MIEDLPAGSSTEFFLLDMNGRIEHAANMYDYGETALLIADSGRGEALVKFLEWMRITYQVEVAVPDYAVSGTREDGPVLVGKDGAEVPEWGDAWTAVVQAYTRGTDPAAASR